MQKSFHGGDLVASALQAQGVRFLFTLCGGHISPILTGCNALGIRVVDVRDEATAVFAADAVARLTGVPGVAAVTAGPGLTNTLTALKNAYVAQSPVVLLGGAAPTALQGRGALQDIKQLPVVAPHVKVVKQIRKVRDLVPAVHEAFSVSREGVPGPVFIECPIDILYDEKNVRQWYTEASSKGTSISDRVISWYLQRHVEEIFAKGDNIAPAQSQISLPVASDSCIEAVAGVLAKAERPLIVIGSQALAVSTDAHRVASAIATMGIPVYLSGMARGLLGRDHALQQRHMRRQALRQSDCVILAGVPCDFRLDYGRHISRSSALIAVNRSAREAHLNRRPDIAAIGDAGQFLIRLADRFSHCGERLNGWIEKLHACDLEREREINEKSRIEAEFVNPIKLLHAIDDIASDTATFVADGGDFVSTASYIVRPRGPLRWLDPGAFGTLGVGAGFALGANLCYPGEEIWILYGDGACGYGLVEFDTFVRHGIPVIAVVGNDAGWTQIAREQVKILNDDVGTVLARTDYHKIAEGFGAKGILVKTEDELPKALDMARQAAKAGQPVLINVWLDRTDFREGAISM
jgi:thiamine pyrophosphate-dependent acetolactate synthase large subunit-like protein